jgi:hypothetical protein
MSGKEDTNTEAFVMHRRRMYESDAYKSLGKVEMKILARIEIELMRHAGKDNGRLICTYDDFAEYGIRRPSITPGLRKLGRVGLLEITQRGRISSMRNPHHYRLTYLHSYDENGNKIAPTDEWKKYRAKPQKRRRAQNTGNENVSGTGNENVSGTGNENVPMQPTIAGNENVPTLYNLPISYPSVAGVAAEAEGDDAPAMFGIGHNAGPPLGGPVDLPELVDDWRNANAACAGCRPAEIDWPPVAATGLDIPTFLLRGYPDCVLGDS